jgi:uncharacterized protein involved in exopolysaccharide biosynthesis
MPDVTPSKKQTALVTVLGAIAVGFTAGFVFSLIRPRR